MEEKTVVTMEDLQRIVASNIAEALKEAGLGKTEIKHGVFPGTEEFNGLSKELKFAKWFAAVAKKDPVALMSMKALTGDATTGSYLVPEEFAAEVVHVANQYGLARRLGRRWPMVSDTLNIPESGTYPTVTWLSSQGDQVSTSNPTFAKPVLAIKTLGALCELSNELIEDNNVNLMSFLAALIGETFAGEEDSQAFAGTGSPFTGALSLASASVVSSTVGSYASFTVDDLNNLAMGVAAKYRQGAAFFMHPSVWSAIRMQKDNDSAYLVQQPLAGQPASVLGYPVYESEKMPSTDAAATAFVAFFNPGKHLNFGDRKGIEIAMSADTYINARSMFERNETAVRAIERIGLIYSLEAGVGVLKTK